MGVPHEVQPLTAEELAQRIDDLSLDEIKASTRPSLPRPGGEYDTKSGWAERLGMSRSSVTFKDLWDTLADAGLITAHRGMHQRDGYMMRITLFHSPALARRCG